MKAQAKGVSASELRDLVEWAIAHCPVSDAAKRAVPTTVQIEV